MSGFLHEVARFREWVRRGAPDTRGLHYGPGEWECNYPHWVPLLAAVRERLHRPAELSAQESHELLYVLARDNEDERIAAMLEADPPRVERLLPLSLAYPDPAARWQIAVILPGALGDRAAEPLRQFARDDDEYVRRRASAALAEIDGDVD